MHRAPSAWVPTFILFLASGVAAQAPQSPVAPSPSPKPVQSQPPADSRPAPTVTVQNPASSAPTSANTPTVVSDAGHPAAHTLDAADLEAFFDGVLPLQLERSDVAGASVIVMKDGQVQIGRAHV